MESSRHAALKVIALEWLARCGCSAMALEVTTPIPRWRVDAAGWCDHIPDFSEQSDWLPRRIAARPSAPLFETVASPRTASSPGVIVIECKQDRADFLRDRGDLSALLVERERLLRRQLHLEESHVKRFEPQLRQSGLTLFPQTDPWEFGASRLASYRQVLCELRRLDGRIHGGVKHCLFERYRLADRLYILAPAGMLREREVPPGWGMLETTTTAISQASRRRRGTPDSEATPVEQLSVRVVRSAPGHNGDLQRRLRFLRNIAVAASRTVTALVTTLATGPGSSVG